MHRVGLVNVKVNLPVKFVAGGVSLTCKKLFVEIEKLYPNKAELRQKAHGAINATIDFPLIDIRQSFHNAYLREELEKFLKIIWRKPGIV